MITWHTISNSNDINNVEFRPRVRFSFREKSRRLNDTHTHAAGGMNDDFIANQQRDDTF